jgi:2-haloacid dehalogenase
MIWREYQKPIENVLDLLEKLRKHYRLAALTVISKEWLDYKREKYNLDGYFETIVSSGYSGLIKPDPDFYKLLIEKLHVRPEECVFIDDSTRNLLPAEELGMKTLLFTGQKELEKNLKEIGIRY